MKLELLSNSQLKIILEKDDIKKWNIDFESLNYKDKKTKNMFFHIMKKAYDEVGFDATDAKLVVEAVSGENNFTLFITKIYNKIDFELLKNFLHIDNPSKIKLNSYIFKFETLEDVITCAKLLSNNTSIIKSSLYLYKNQYYIKLLINNKYLNGGSLSHTSVKSVLLEYSTQITNPYFDAILSEHGEKIVKTNLIQKFSKIF